MKILAIDQSLKHSAFAVFEDGTFKTVFSWKLEVNDSNEVCYEEFYKNINKIIKQEKPDVVICERMFMGFNAAVYGKLSQLTGMIRCICIKTKTKFEEVPIASYRSALGIKNKKEIAQEFIKNMFSDVTFNNDDETDSLALGLGYIILKQRQNNVK